MYCVMFDLFVFANGGWPSPSMNHAVQRLFSEIFIACPREDLLMVVNYDYLANKRLYFDLPLTYFVQKLLISMLQNLG